AWQPALAPRGRNRWGRKNHVALLEPAWRLPPPQRHGDPPGFSDPGPAWHSRPLRPRWPSPEGSKQTCLQPDSGVYSIETSEARPPPNRARWKVMEVWGRSHRSPSKLLSTAPLDCHRGGATHGDVIHRCRCLNNGGACAGAGVHLVHAVAGDRAGTTH